MICSRLLKPLTLFCLSLATSAQESASLSEREVLISEARKIIENDINNIYRSRKFLKPTEFQFLLQKKVLQLMDIRDALSRTPADFRAPFTDARLNTRLPKWLAQGSGAVPETVAGALSNYFEVLKITRESIDIADGLPLNEQDKQDLAKDEEAFALWEKSLENLAQAIRLDPEYVDRNELKSLMEKEGLKTDSIGELEHEVSNPNTVETLQIMDEFLLDAYALQAYHDQESLFVSEPSTQSGHTQGLVPKAIPVHQAKPITETSNEDTPRERAVRPLIPEGVKSSNNYTTKKTLEILGVDGRTRQIPKGTKIYISNPNSKGKLNVSYSSHEGLIQGMIFKGGYGEFSKAFDPLASSSNTGGSTPSSIPQATDEIPPHPLKPKSGLRYKARKWFELTLRDAQGNVIKKNYRVNVGDVVEISNHDQKTITVTVPGVGTGKAAPGNYGNFNSTFSPMGHEVVAPGTNPARPTPIENPLAPDSISTPNSAAETLQKLHLAARALTLKPAENISSPHKNVRCARQTSRAFRLAKIPYRTSDGQSIPFPFDTADNMRVTGLYEYLTSQSSPRWKLWPRSKGTPPPGAIALTNRSIFPHSRLKDHTRSQWKHRTRSHIGIVGEHGIVYNNSGSKGGIVVAGISPGHKLPDRAAPHGATIVEDSWVHSSYMMYLVPEGYGNE